MEDSGYLYAVSDADGIVGVFSSLANAESALAQFPDRGAYVVWRRRAMAGGDAGRVWFVPNSACTNLVSYWSNDRAAAERVRDLLARRLRAAFEDPVDYWEAALDSLIPSAEARLARRRAIRQEFAGLTEEESAAKLLELRRIDADNLERLCGEADGPIAQLLRENMPALSLADAIIDEDAECVSEL